MRITQMDGFGADAACTLTSCPTGQKCDTYNGTCYTPCQVASDCSSGGTCDSLGFCHAPLTSTYELTTFGKVMIAGAGLGVLAAVGFGAYWLFGKHATPNLSASSPCLGYTQKAIDQVSDAVDDEVTAFQERMQRLLIRLSSLAKKL